MDKEYLTVKEFAAAAGVSTQRIYQRLAKDLQRGDPGGDCVTATEHP